MRQFCGGQFSGGGSFPGGNFPGEGDFLEPKKMKSDMID